MQNNAFMRRVGLTLEALKYLYINQENQGFCLN